jgi:hypothetical protein
MERIEEEEVRDLATMTLADIQTVLDELLTLTAGQQAQIDDLRRRVALLEGEVAILTGHTR